MGAQLGVILTVNNVAVRDGQNSIKARAGVPLGHVTVTDSGGVGSVTHALVDKPDWDTRANDTILTHNEGTWSIAPLLPPIPGITSHYKIQATDSATPTPATATADLAVTMDVPAGTILLTREGAPPVQLDTAVWQLLDHTVVPVANEGRLTNRSFTVAIRKNLVDNRLCLVVVYKYTSPTRGNISSQGIYFYSGDFGHDQFCRAVVSSLGCSEASGTAAWQTLLSHLPPYIP